MNATNVAILLQKAMLDRILGKDGNAHIVTQNINQVCAISPLSNYPPKPKGGNRNSTADKAII